MAAEDQEETMTNASGDLPVDFTLLDKATIRGLRTRAQAESLRELTLRSLRSQGREEDFRANVEERADGLFDMIVLTRAN